MSSKLSVRRATVRKPKICASAACPPPPPPPPPVTDCWIEFLPAGMEFPSGAIMWGACKEEAETGADFEEATLPLDPEIMGFDAETPTNCQQEGLYIFELEPPPGPLKATVFFRWWEGWTCTKIETKNY